MAHSSDSSLRVFLFLARRVVQSALEVWIKALGQQPVIRGSFAQYLMQAPLHEVAS